MPSPLDTSTHLLAAAAVVRVALFLAGLMQVLVPQDFFVPGPASYRE